MSASEIQHQRMREYFIEAAKETLRGEGLRAVSARTIAARAGYSYATLYNYFKDLNALIFECVTDFQQEIEEQVLSAAIPAAEARDGEEAGLESIRKGLLAWVNYFVQYPGIFELFFLERIGDIGNSGETAGIIYNSILPACSRGLEMLKAEGKLSEDDAAARLEALRYQCTGLLLYYSNRKNPGDYPGLLKKLEGVINFIFGDTN